MGMLVCECVHVCVYVCVRVRVCVCVCLLSMCSAGQQDDDEIVVQTTYFFYLMLLHVKTRHYCILDTRILLLKLLPETYSVVQTSCMLFEIQAIERRGMTKETLFCLLLNTR